MMLNGESWKILMLKSKDPAPPTHYVRAHPFNQAEAKIEETKAIPHQRAKPKTISHQPKN